MYTFLYDLQNPRFLLYCTKMKTKFIMIYTLLQYITLKNDHLKKKTYNFGSLKRMRILGQSVTVYRIWWDIAQ